jgi:hypothetical protein
MMKLAREKSADSYQNSLLTPHNFCNEWFVSRRFLRFHMFHEHSRCSIVFLSPLFTLKQIFGIINHHRLDLFISHALFF